MEQDSMNKNDAMDLAKTCVEELVEALQGKEPEAFTRYLDFMGRFHRYSLGNILMIMKQRPDAEYVAGFRTWKELGRWVKRGEKGIAILAPMIGKRKDEQDEEARRKEKRECWGFRVVHVFDVKQTEGAELPSLSEIQGDPGDSHRSLQRVIRSLGIELAHGVLPMGINGASSGGRVVIAEGLNIAEEFQVMAHELAHELLHHGTEWNHRDLPKTVVETEAEAVAYVVSRAHGIDAMAVSNEYIRLYRGDAKTIEESLGRILSTASRVLFLMSEVDASDEEVSQGEYDWQGAFRGGVGQGA